MVKRNEQLPPDSEVARKLGNRIISALTSNPASRLNGRPLLARQPFAADAFDQVILGCVNVIADEMNPARVAALRLGMGESMVAFTAQINCGSEIGRAHV